MEVISHNMPNWTLLLLSILVPHRMSQRHYFTVYSNSDLGSNKLCPVLRWASSCSLSSRDCGLKTKGTASLKFGREKRDDDLDDDKNAVKHEMLRRHML